jgi:NADPH-dependent 2,4-dienoyl-CoA reductase/sulfur reductase-like enzyme/rhodanese-related sulfurtransferase
MSKADRRLVIVGGVAGGASCAARARRLSETAKIILIERGPFVSFANCGLPYYVGDVIADEASLLVATPELFRERFDIDVRTNQEVVAIDREARIVTVNDRQAGNEYRMSYDDLVLAPGAAPIVPPLPGIDLPGIFSLRTIPDSRKIRDWIAERQAKRAIVVGGGFIGLEMAESLTRRGIVVTLIEGFPQVMAPFDPEMVEPVHDWLRAHGVALFLNAMVTGFAQAPDGQLVISTSTGVEHAGGLVILAIGIRPETSLAQAAGLELGSRKGICVDRQMRTSDPHIWAVGDAVEVRDIVTGEWTLLPLAGPANRQGRIAANAIFGRASSFRGVQGTTVCGTFGLTLAATGANEKTLERLGMAYEKAYLHPDQHVGYYPGARPIAFKLLFSPDDGRILGAQAVGEEGAERRIDVIAMALRMGGTVYDLEDAELCYAPQYGAAKDPVNVAGMIAANALRGDAPLAYWEDLAGPHAAILVDVRDPDEFAEGHLEEAVNIPLPQLRARLDELDPSREIWVYCRVGHRAHYATRILRLHGFDARNLSGGITTGSAGQMPITRKSLA